MIFSLRPLLAALGMGIGSMSLAQSPPSCPNIPYEASAAAEPARLTLDRIEGQAFASSPARPQVLGKVEHLCFAVYLENSRALAGTGLTDDEGRFALPSSHLPAADYVLIGSKPGSVLGSVRVPLRLSGEPASARAQRGLSLHLQAGGGPQSGRAAVLKNLELRRTLIEMHKTDQDIRMEVLARSTFSNMDPELWERMSRIDAQTHTRLLAIVREYGWPTRDVVSFDGSEAASNLLQHVPHETAKQLLPLVEIAFRKGLVTAERYAMLVDRVRIAEGLPALYGTDVIFSEAEEDLIFRPTERDAEIDARRRDIGMVPLAEYRETVSRLYAAKKRELRQRTARDGVPR